MKLHTLKPKIKKSKKKRLGRGVGSGKGVYAGRGIKGQKARSGYKIPSSPLIAKLPKLRGEGFKKAKRVNRQPEIQIVNLDDLQKRYKAGEEVSVKSLVEKGLVDKKTRLVKILARGDLKKKLKFAPDLLFSEKAKESIKKTI